MTEPNKPLPVFRSRNGQKIFKTTAATVTQLKKAHRAVTVTNVTNKKKSKKHQYDVGPLEKLQLSKQMVEKTVMKEVKFKHEEPKENKCQGFILDKEFISGETNKRSKDGEKIVHGSGHYIDTDNLKNKKNKFGIFKAGDDKLSVLVIKDGLSKDGKKGLVLMEKIHQIVNPNLLKLCCKISGLPMGWKIEHGLSSDDAKKRWGNATMVPEYILQTGRSCKMHYKNKDGDLKCFMMENPVSRMSYYSINEIEKLWNSKEYEIESHLGDYNGDNEDAILAYFEDMKQLYMKYLKYFFSPADREKYGDKKLVDTYFGDLFHFSSNIFTPDSPCACHHDTLPWQPEFPSGITAMASLEKGKDTRRKMGRGDGELCFVHLGCNVQYNFGDVVLMNPKLYHGLLPLKGPRYSLVLYNNRGIVVPDDEA